MVFHIVMIIARYHSRSKLIKMNVSLSGSVLVISVIKATTSQEDSIWIISHDTRFFISNCTKYESRPQVHKFSTANCVNGITKTLFGKTPTTEKPSLFTVGEVKIQSCWYYQELWQSKRERLVEINRYATALSTCQALQFIRARV